MTARYPHRREFTRVPLRLEVGLSTQEGCVFSGPARDLSLIGVYVQGDCALSLNTPCSVRIRLNDQIDGPCVQATGQVVRVEPDGVAVEFTAVPLGALEHLRNLVLYNASDPTEIEKEFSSHIGLRRRG